MSAVEKALETQLSNIQTKTGKSLAALYAEVLGQGLEKHGEMVKWAKHALSLGHGDANTLVHMARKSAEASSAEAAGTDDPLDAIYVGGKADQRPIHDALMAKIHGFGSFEIAPKNGYVSLRRARQFAMLGPKTNTRFEVGLNLKEEASHKLMKPVKSGGMCQYIISLHGRDEIDEEIIALIQRAYQAAG